MWCICKVVVLLNRPIIAFLMFFVPSLLSLPKPPIIVSIVFNTGVNTSSISEFNTVLYYHLGSFVSQFVLRSRIEFEPSYAKCEDLYPCGRMSFRNFNPTVEVSLILDNIIIVVHFPSIFPVFNYSIV